MIDPEVKAKLQEVRALLSDPSRWTKGAFARDASGHNTMPSAGNAVCWCLNGAVRKVFGDESIWSPGLKVLGDEIFKTHLMSIAGFNDMNTHAEVIALLDKVLAS